MCDVPIFYATTEGQTRRICAFTAEQVHKHGLDSRAIAIVSEDASDIDWTRVRGAGLGASLHAQKHQREPSSSSASITPRYRRSHRSSSQ